MTRYYFVRHGTTDFNERSIYFGATDCPLNVDGILQSKELGNHLGKVHFDEIYTSPMKRCTDTTRLITIQKKPIVSEELLEIDFGLWEGMHYRDCMEKYPEEFKNWSTDYRSYAPPDGEKYSEFYERVRAFYHDELTADRGNVLIVSHKGVLQLLTSLLLTGDDSLFWNFNFLSGKYSILEKESGHCTIKRLNI
jgi:alpha-ribazole phosphatase